MDQVGVGDRRIDGILITHEHHDHVSGVGVVARGMGATVWCTDGTRAVISDRLKGVEKVRGIGHATPFTVGDLVVEPIAKPHDAAEPVGFLLHHEGETLGVFTDLGSVDAVVGEAISRCTTLVMESNYDPRMLADGPYPAHLKGRIGSEYGHLANADAANALARYANLSLRTLVLAHLSEQNNSAEHVRRAFTQATGPKRTGLERWVSFQDRPTRLFGRVATAGA